MSVNTRVLAIELKLCLAVATTQADFKSTQKARDGEQDGKASVAGSGRELESGVQVTEGLSEGGLHVREPKKLSRIAVIGAR
jgi:hypothetical protein